MYRKGLRTWVRHADYILLDELCMFAAMTLAFFFCEKLGRPIDPELQARLTAVMPIGNLIVFISMDPLCDVRCRSPFRGIRMTLVHTLLCLGVSALGLFLIDGSITISRRALGLIAAVYTMLTLACRGLWRLAPRGHPWGAEGRRSLLIVTTEADAPVILRRMQTRSCERFTVAGLVLIDRDARGSAIDGTEVVANLSDAADYICRAWIDEVLFCRASLDERTQALIDRCREMALTVHLYVALQGVDERKQSIESIAGCEVLTINLNMMSAFDSLLKRLFDIAVGLFGSCLTLILLAVIGPYIKRVSPGPLLFRQDRIGENGRRFKMYKIRSMHVDADRQKAEYLGENTHDSDMMFKLDFDPRVIGNRILPDGTLKTGLGYFIRKTSLDEFPQFFNVLRGEMSVVGIRPPTVDEWEKYEYRHRARMSFRPGMTGLWQVSRRKDQMDFDEVVKLDTEYIAHWSMGRDICLMLRTVGVMFRGLALRPKSQSRPERP